MAFQMYERPSSRPVGIGVKDSTQVTAWNLKTDSPGEDEVDAVFHVLANTPTTLNGLVRRNVKVDPVEGRTDRWTAEVEYGRTGQDGTEDAVGATPSDPSLRTPSQPASEGDTPSESALGIGYAFNIGTETTHVTHSRRQMGRIKRGADVISADITLTGTSNVVVPTSFGGADDVGKVIWISSPPAGWYAGGYKILAVDLTGLTWTLDRAPARDSATGAATWVEKPQADDYSNAIGVTKDGFNGVDVLRPKMDLTRTVSWPNLSMAYMHVLYELVGKKNDRPWYGYAAGDVLFSGVSCQYSMKDRYSCTYHFLISWHETDIAIVPGELVVPYKRGWDYLWVDFEEWDDEEDAMRRLIRPRGVYVEEVYADGDFNSLLIGR